MNCLFITARGRKVRKRKGRGSEGTTDILLPPLKPALRLPKFGMCIVNDICDPLHFFHFPPRLVRKQKGW
jgi:hypothetical protein